MARFFAFHSEATDDDVSVGLNLDTLALPASAAPFTILTEAEALSDTPAADVADRKVSVLFEDATSSVYAIEAGDTSVAVVQGKHTHPELVIDLDAVDAVYLCGKEEDLLETMHSVSRVYFFHLPFDDVETHKKTVNHLMSQERSRSFFSEQMYSRRTITRLNTAKPSDIAQGLLKRGEFEVVPPFDRYGFRSNVDADVALRKGTFGLRTQGHVLFGPYVSLPAGSYVITMFWYVTEVSEDALRGASIRQLRFDVFNASRDTLLTTQAVPVDEISPMTGEAVLEFEIASGDTAQTLEIRIEKPQGIALSVQMIRIEG